MTTPCADPELSLIVCTKNPRHDYLAKTFAALREQTLPLTAWQLVVVDNDSTPPLRTRIELDWHPNARLVTESEPGFTPALLRGIQEVSGNVCVLVHDDNLLAPEYLEQVCRIAREWPQLGAWGGGYEPEYEEQPAPHLAPYLGYLAVNACKHDHWSNRLYDYAATPCGAGMAVRTDVLRHYAGLLRHDARRRSLGRHTDKLTSCEDFDIAFTAIDLDYGTGVFSCLRVTHLIPKARVQPDYLRRLVEGHAYSTVLLHSFRGDTASPPRGWLARIRRWRRLCRLSQTEREVQTALARGEERAFALLTQTSNE